MRILVNGVSSRSGGGAVILEGYVRALRRVLDELPDAEYVVVCPAANTFDATPRERLSILDVGNVKGPWALARFYAWTLPRLTVQRRIDVVVNLADFVPPLHVPQVYFFDWAYLVYQEDPSLWGGLRFHDRVARKLKARAISLTLPFATRIVAQTKTMADRLRHKAKREGPTVLPTPTGIAVSDWGGRSVTGRVVRILCLANYAPHKNLEILPDVAAALSRRGFGAVIALTLSPDDAYPLLERARILGVEGALINIGPVPRDRVEAVIQSFDGMLIPSVLETYCLPFVEAMACGISVFAPDRDFARDVCGDAAFYFEPTKPESVADALVTSYSDDGERRARLARGTAIAAKLPSWESFAMAMHAEARCAVGVVPTVT
jgi:glycosyltransferase involved in cell wall biosynthesis